jgi:hypothetical protein
MTSQTVHQVRISTTEKPRNNLQLAIDGSLKPQGVLRRNFGEMMSTLREDMPQNYGF